MDNSFWITKDKRAFAWGGNSKGELGLGHENSIFEPTILPPPKKSPWKWFAYGYSHVVAMTRSGEVYTWGCNAFGQLGIKLSSGHKTSTPQLLLPPGDSPWEKLYCGSFFTIGITADGKAYAWGDDSYCQVSGATGKVYDDRKYKERRDAASSYNNNKRHFATPQYILPRNGSFWKTFTCGENHVIGITNDGLVYGWGSNEYWQTGGSTKVERTVHLLPVPKDHQDSEWIRFGCGSNYTIGITKCGIVAMWKNLYSAKEPYVFKIESHVPWDRFYYRNCVGIMVMICRDHTTYIALPAMKDQIDPNLKLTPTPSFGEHWKSFVPGFHSFGICSSGNLYSWGISPQGALGLGPGVKAQQRPKIIPPPKGTSWDPNPESFLNPTLNETYRTTHEDLIKFSLLSGENIGQTISKALISTRCAPFMNLENLEDMPFEAITQLLAMIYGFRIHPASIEYQSFKRIREFITRHRLVDFEDDVTHYLFRSYSTIRSHILAAINSQESESVNTLVEELIDIEDIDKRDIDKTDRKNFSWYIKNLYYQVTFPDVTVYVDDVPIDAHQFVLRAKSKFFRDLTQRDRKKIPDYDSKSNTVNVFDKLGLTLSSLNILLEYFYLGYVATKMTKANAKELLSARKMLKLSKKDDMLFYICKDVIME